MKSVLASIVFLVSFTIQAKVIHHCTPEDTSSAGFNYVEILVDNYQNYHLVIEWNRPVGKEDVEQNSAEYFDDMTMYGYVADGIDATLSFYNEDDYNGERIEFILDKRNFTVVCMR